MAFRCIHFYIDRIIMLSQFLCVRVLKSYEVKIPRLRLGIEKFSHFTKVTPSTYSHCYLSFFYNTFTCNIYTCVCFWQIVHFAVIFLITKFVFFLFRYNNTSLFQFTFYIFIYVLFFSAIKLSEEIEILCAYISCSKSNASLTMYDE